MENQSSSILGGIVGGVANMAGSAVQAAGKVASSGIGSASSIGSSTIGNAGSIASSALGTASSIASSAIGTASSLASGTLNTATSIANSAIGTVSGVMSQAMGLATDSTTKLLTEISNVANGALDGAGGLLNDTMNLAQKLASGALNTTGELAQSILGDTSETLAKCCGGCCGGACSASSNASSEAVSQMAQQSQAQCNQVLEQVTSEMNQGLVYISTFDAIVGNMNGASNLLQASLQKALDMTIANMMKKIVSAINAAHGMTHPMFISIFQMTWNENKQWLPRHVADEFKDPGDGSCIPKCVYDIVKEIPEFFDFIQKVMGGAIADIMYSTEDIVNGIWATVNKSISMGVDVSLNVSIPLHVPMMSISKQIEDVMRKIYAIKELIRAKACLILEKLKKMEAPELYICKPKEFELILWALTEAEFIMNNLPIVLDKILEYFMNIFVAEFSKQAEQIIEKIFKVWKRVIEIVPPLQDLVELAWAIPNQADACCNLALNAALQTLWPMVEPCITLPYQCISTVSAACDAATMMIRQNELIV